MKHKIYYFVGFVEHEMVSIDEHDLCKKIHFRQDLPEMLQNVSISQIF